MPNITLTEKDYTAAGFGAYENFAVVVPGFIASNAKLEVFDDNGVYECDSQKAFLENVGQVSGIVPGSTDTTPIHYGNQIAYELLGLGYRVLYLNMGTIGKTRIAATIEKDTFWEPLKDRAAYDFRYIVTGLLEGNTTANNCISKLARGAENGGNRGDCTALIDIDDKAYANAKTQAAAIAAARAEIVKLTEADKYTAIFTPSVCYSLDAARTAPYAGNNKFPASFHYLVCARTASLNNYAEWYAVAGYTRGISSTFIIDSAEVKFGEIAVNALAPRFDNGTKKAVNVIAKIRNNYYLWGNRTAQLLGTEGSEDGDLVASHFLNIRQLCSTLKKQTYIACRRFTFDPNSNTLWINFKSAIEPTLERMKADQGIEDYKIIRVSTDQKATFKAQIRIIPIEAVEDFDIEISLEDSFGEAVASMIETE